MAHYIGRVHLVDTDGSEVDVHAKLDSLHSFDGLGEWSGVLDGSADWPGLLDRSELVQIRLADGRKGSVRLVSCNEPSSVAVMGAGPSPFG